jgi:NitT/TauT family transport system permease protein/taurine transport system permease protein
MKFLQHIWSIYLRTTARFPALCSFVPFIPLLIAWTLVTELAVFPRAFLPGPIDVVNAFGTLTYKGVLTQYLRQRCTSSSWGCFWYCDWNTFRRLGGIE